MRILQVVQRFPPAVGGGEQVVYQISKELVKRGHEVTVATSNWLLDNDIPGFSQSGVNIRTPRHPFPSQETNNGIEISRFKPYFRFWTYTANPSLVRFLQRNIGSFDVVHAHYYMFMESALSAFFARAESTPFVITIHRSSSILDVYPRIYRIGKKLYDATIGSLILSAASKIIVLVPQIRNEFLELGAPEGSLTVVPNGIDFERFASSRARTDKENLNSSERIVLFVGRLEKQKGPQHIIRAIPEICEYFPDTRFIFVGEDWGYRATLGNLCERLGVGEKCTFTGRISDYQLSRMYENADVFVLPAIGEGFGLVALESLYCGTPVILADSDSLSFILQEFGGYPLDMDSNIPEQIANHVMELFSNGSDRKSLLAARNKIESKYSWGPIARELERIYREVTQ